MYLLGILSLIQILFLPGLILAKLLKLPRGLITSLVYVFGLSLIFNHLYVVVLTHLNINTPAAHYLIFAVEIGFLLYLYHPVLTEPSGAALGSLPGRLKEKWASLWNGLGQPGAGFQEGLKTLVWVFFLGWSLLSILWAVDQLISSLGSVFTLWDSVVSWNHWAVEWFSNSQPLDTKHYAQLIPTNFSITYSFMQSSALQFFAKGFMPLFAVYLLLLMLDLGLTKHDYAYFIGLVITQYLLKRFYLDLISSGYVDVPVMFFTFLTIQTLIKASGSDQDQDRIRYVLLGSIFAAGTALTKQNGLLVWLVYPLLAYYLVLSDVKSLPPAEKLKKLGLYFLISGLMLLPWYLYNEIRILEGAKSNLLMLISQEHHAGRTLLERLIKAYKDLSIYFYLFPLAVIGLPFIPKTIRSIALSILVPYSLIWAFFFSLYTRNLSIGFALLGLTSGFVMARILEAVIKVTDKLKLGKLPLGLGLALVLAAILSGGWFLTDAKLAKHQREQQRLALDQDLNRELYQFFDDLGRIEPVFTNYPLRYLPGFEDKQINIGGFKDYDFYLQRRAEYPEVRFMLITLTEDSEAVLKEIYGEIDQGKARIVFQEKNLLFVEILE